VVALMAALSVGHRPEKAVDSLHTRT
jgi:hypothetical protein